MTESQVQETVLTQESEWAGFVAEHECWDESQEQAANRILRTLRDKNIEGVRVGFVDQHGLVRSKNIATRSMASVFRNGLGFASSLLSKDTSGTTVYSAFESDGGVGVKEMAGAADMILVPDPRTFRILPWDDGTAWIIGDLYLRTGARMPFCTRGMLQRMLSKAKDFGLEYTVGIELEFHLYKHEPGVDPASKGGVEHITNGYQLLLDQWGEDLRDVLMDIRRNLEKVDIFLRTLEIEFGPSQVEVTLDPQSGITAADDVILLRQAVKTIAKRHGLHATFMCRPKIDRSFSSGWHLHQSLTPLNLDEAQHSNAFIGDGEHDMSQAGSSFVAGLLNHAMATCIFAVPTLNGYKRFQPYSLAPDRVSWARENRGAMLRLVGDKSDGSLRIENRIGEPAANPYLYLGTQLAAGLAGIEAAATLPPTADNPYVSESPKLPGSLSDAINALEEDTAFKKLIGEEFCDYFTGIKRFEVRRFETTVSDLEQQEYFDLF